MSYSDTIRETTINSDEDGKLIQTSWETVCDYKHYCHDVCFNIVSELSSDQIGGNGLTVEIDESKFGKTKYHKGRYIKGQWIFGGICRETKQFFVTPVDKRDSATLIPIILSRIRPGSKIISDCWRSYKVLSELDFEHLTVQSQVSFRRSYNCYLGKRHSGTLVIKYPLLCKCIPKYKSQAIGSSSLCRFSYQALTVTHLLWPKLGFGLIYILSGEAA